MNACSPSLPVGFAQHWCSWSCSLSELFQERKKLVSSGLIAASLFDDIEERSLEVGEACGGLLSWISRRLHLCEALLHFDNLLLFGPVDKSLHLFINLVNALKDLLIASLIVNKVLLSNL
jgi:hypothetical protein